VTTADAVRWLQSSNDDLVLVRVSGSVQVRKLVPELQGKLAYSAADDMLDAAEKAAQNE
jgi:hypothetical protein